MCTFPRFDLSETSYALPLMADQTPAWREVYSRIADELVGRYTTYWAAVDWLTLIGHDPNQDNYPPDWLVWMPEHLRGHYDPPGWTANGVEPWGLQPDPVIYFSVVSLICCSAPMPTYPVMTSGKSPSK
jgi:hypothetical protein